MSGKQLTASAVRQNNTTLLFTNQIRQKTGVLFGNPETPTGGMALRLYASVCIHLRRIQALKSNGEVIGSVPMYEKEAGKAPEVWHPVIQLCGCNKMNHFELVPL